jgi:hypothetical protein
MSENNELDERLAIAAIPEMVAALRAVGPLWEPWGLGGMRCRYCDVAWSGYDLDGTDNPERHDDDCTWRLAQEALRKAGVE